MGKYRFLEIDLHSFHSLILGFVDNHRKGGSDRKLESVDTSVMPDGEQRVTLKRRYAGTMVLRQGVLPQYIWVHWSPNSDKKSEQSVIRNDINHWNQFSSLPTQ
jgi:hypothetical protein